MIGIELSKIIDIFGIKVCLMDFLGQFGEAIYRPGLARFLKPDDWVAVEIEKLDKIRDVIVA